MRRFGPVLALLVSGCAEIAPPPGGPVDLTSPEIVSAFPESLATGVDPSSPIVVVFSEKVDRNTVRKAAFLRPFRPLQKIDWDGETATFRFRGGMPPDSTVSFVLTGGVLDRDRNRITGPFRRTFSTGDSIDAGIVAGRVYSSRAQGKPSFGRGTVFVWVYRAERDSLPDPAHDDPDYLAVAGGDGSFVVDGLPIATPLLLYALLDGDENREIRGTNEYFTAHDDTLTLTAADPRIDALSAYLINPRSPGIVSGRLASLVDTTQVDTLSFGVLLSETVKADTVAAWPPARKPREGRVDTIRAFSVRGVPPGRYRVAAFLDLNRDGRWNRTEPLAAPVVVNVAPGDETGDLVLERPPAPNQED